MKKTILIFTIIVLNSCQSIVNIEDLGKINGYWEIKQVEFINGEKKDYKVNETIDYFEIIEEKGFRQKVMPQFNGKYLTNGIKEKIRIVKEKESFFIEYHTNFGMWKDEILKLEDSTLILKNKKNIKYTYKKYKPFTLK